MAQMNSRELRGHRGTSDSEIRSRTVQFRRILAARALAVFLALFAAPGFVHGAEPPRVLMLFSNERAGEVIRRLRLLLKKGEVEWQPLAIDEVVREILKLARTDLANHGAAVESLLAPDLPRVQGNAVQIQQVVLNLVMNACDAMAGNEPGDRCLTARTLGDGDAGVKVEVSDAGCGLPESGAERVLQRLAAMPGHPPVIAITGHDSTETEARALGAGASIYLRKPIHQKPLLAAIARCTGIDHPSFRCVLSPDQRDHIQPENTKTKT
jgi:signal transduction histidine kinase